MNITLILLLICPFLIPCSMDRAMKIAEDTLDKFIVIDDRTGGKYGN